MKPDRIWEIYETLGFSNPIERQMVEELFDYIDELEESLYGLSDTERNNVQS